MSLTIIRMNNRVKSEPYSDELFQEALSLLDELTGELDSRDLCRGMASWGERLLAPARERIQSKRGIERYKGLELFFASGVDVADEVEAAKSKERSKKVLPNYDYTVWRIRKAAAENARAKVDPADATIDPLLRFVELENMPVDTFRERVGKKHVYYRDFALASLGFDREGARALCADSEWGLVFDGTALRLHGPDGKKATLPKDADAERAALAETKKQLAEAQAKRNEQLRDAFITGDAWPAWLFRLLFLDHPLATTATLGLVFEVGAGKSWTSFIASGEGAWLDSKQAAVTVDADALVRVAHPSELSDAEFERWCVIAADEQWLPPFAQLSSERKPKPIADVLSSLAEPFALTLLSKLKRLGFAALRVDEGIEAHSRRIGADGTEVRVEHRGLPHKRRDIGRSKKAALHGLSFYRGAKTIPENKVSMRARIELVRMLESEFG